MKIREPYVDVYLSDGVDEYTICGQYQYDHGQKIRVHGLSTQKIIQVQFAHEEMLDVITVAPIWQDGVLVSDIPDIILSQSKRSVCYLYLEDDTSGITIKVIHMPIIPRIKPAGYTMSPQQIDNYTNLVKELNDQIDEVNGTKEGLSQIVADAEQTITDINAAKAGTQEAIDNANIAIKKTEDATTFATEQGQAAEEAARNANLAVEAAKKQTVPTRYKGIAITGISIKPTKYQTGIAEAHYNDEYLNTKEDTPSYGNLYSCVQGGNQDTALWIYSMNIRGDSGGAAIDTVGGIAPDATKNIPLVALGGLSFAMSQIDGGLNITVGEII